MYCLCSVLCWGIQIITLVIKCLSVHLEHVWLPQLKASYMKSRVAQILVLQSLIKQALGQWVLAFLADVQIISFEKFSANRKPVLQEETVENQPPTWLTTVLIIWD